MDSESLDELNLNYDAHRSLIEILDKKFHLLKANAGRTAGAYVIFTGIMYIQAALPSATRGKRWIPICLLTSVSAAFWLTLITTVNDCLRVKQQQDSIFMEQERLYRKIYWIQNGRRQNDGGAPITGNHQSLAKSFAFERRQRYAYVGIVHSALFYVTFLVS
ncbi:hypothetical protein CDL12_11416 [Handroanthus impetiginosus]|uniref:Uncharacterized protein n=1 Tax=Handroanthus impetiginosus TaxID=429701 RepID=A0A2G9HEH2_9LAMI|nr:hypothetical protein CDL12_11416 [Handroanthus impetiginosus]